MPLIAALSGPERTRAQAIVALEDARIPELPADHHAQMDWPRKLTALPSGEEPTEPHGFIAVHVGDGEGLDVAARTAESAGWVLRAHYDEPLAPKVRIA